MKNLTLEQILVEFNASTEQYKPFDKIERFDAVKHKDLNNFESVNQIIDLDSVSPVYIIGGYAYWFLSGGFVHLEFTRNGFMFNNSNKFIFKTLNYFDSEVKNTNWFKFNKKRFEAFVTELHLKYQTILKLNEDGKNKLAELIQKLKDTKHLYSHCYEKQYILFGTYATIYKKPFVSLQKNKDGVYYASAHYTENSYPTDLFKSNLMIDFAESGKLLTIPDYVNYMESIGANLSYGFYTDFYLGVLNLYLLQNPTKNKFIFNGHELELLGDSVIKIDGETKHKTNLHKIFNVKQLLEFKDYLIKNFYQ